MGKLTSEKLEFFVHYHQIVKIFRFFMNFPRRKKNFLGQMISYIQRLAKRLVRGCEKFVSALAYLFCLALPGSCIAISAYFCPISVDFVNFPEFSILIKKSH